MADFANNEHGCKKQKGNLYALEKDNNCGIFVDCVACKDDDVTFILSADYNMDDLLVFGKEIVDPKPLSLAGCINCI